MHRTRIVHILFAISIIAKGADGVLEIVGGVALFVVKPIDVTHVVRVLTQHELSEDPDDVVAHYLRNSTQHLARGAQVFAALYLLWHGIVKVGLVAALLLRRRWAYPAAMLAFMLFLAYQLYRYSHTHAAELIVLSAMDVVVIVLTWFEYKRLRTTHAFAP